jgi:hypothetical protein
MSDAFLELRFLDDGDGSGKLLARVSANGFAGHGGAHFSTYEIAKFARAIAEFPLPVDPRPLLAGGFWAKDAPIRLDQETLAIVVYPIDHRGHIGVKIRIADESWGHNRPEERRQLQVEIITSYESLRRFSSYLLAIVDGNRTQALLEGDLLP